MPHAIPAAAAFVADLVIKAVVAVTGPLSATAFNVVYATAYYGTQLVIYAGLAEATKPKIPKPEAGSQSFKQSVPPRRRGYGQYRTGGPLACWEAREDKAYLIAMIHDGPITGFVDYYLHDDPVTLVGNVVQSGEDGRYWSPDERVKLFTRLGLPTETAIPEFVTGMPGYWTTAHRGDGIAQLAQIATNGKLVHFSHDFPNGEPMPSAVIQAQKVFDPRDVAQDESDPSTWEFSKNPILCLMHFLAYARGYAFDIGSDESRTFNTAKWNRRFGNTLALWSAAADVCDTASDLSGGGTEPLYEIGFQYNLDDDEAAVVNTFLTGCDGWMATDGKGGFVVYAGKFTAPTVTLSEAHIKSFSLDIGVEAENQVNTINISYTDPAKQYNSTEPDPWVDEDALAAAGRPRVEPLDLPQVQSFTQARRLAKRRMSRHQASCRGTMTVNWGARTILGQRYIAVQLQSGPTLLRDLIVEVTGNVTLDVKTLSLSFPWTAVDADARDGWVPAEEEGTEPPEGDNNPQSELEAPVIDDGWVWWTEDQSRMSLHITGPDRADLTWEVRWRKQGWTLWQPIEAHDETTDHPTLVLQTGVVPSDTIVEAQVRYRTGGDILSDWSNTIEVDTAAPVLPWTADSVSVLMDSGYYTADGGHV